MCLKIVRFWKNLQLHHVVSKMSSSFIESQRNRIVHHLRVDESFKSIANLKDVIRRVMKKIRSNLKTFNISTSLSMRKFDRSRSITFSMKIALKHFLKTKSWSYLKTMMKYLFDEFDVFVNTTVISRILKRLKISRKVMKKKTMKWSQTCRNAYVLKISEYISDMLMFLNESAANEQIMNRRHEWASFEISLSIIRSVKRSERWSILSVYCIDEILTSHIHQRSIIETRFEWFLREEILSRCNAFLESKFVLIMNNVFIHHVEISEIDELMIRHS
jgi:transposase